MNATARQVVALLQLFIEERAGLRYGAEDLDLLHDKISVRAADRDFESLLDYYYYLRYDETSAPEFTELVDSLVINETYFFRESASLALVVEAVRDALALGRKPRVWSAACSTGEEPFTIALLLAQAGLLQDVELLATDISERALAQAQAGTFRPRSVRDKLPGWTESWLHIQQGVPKLDDKIRSSVRFQKLNLMDEAATSALGTFDVILCRNVLIYFSNTTIQRLTANWAKMLTPNGRLLVGACESLLRFSNGLECEERNGAFYYRRLP